MDNMEKILTAEELKQLQNLQSLYSKLYFELGQAEINIEILNEQLEKAKTEKKYFFVDLKKIQLDEEAFAKILNEKYGKGCDFLSIDTEATNIVVFRNIPDWVWETISLLCIEHDNQHGHIISTLQKFGFKEIHRNDENLILGK
mgnify:CR=1 FL=1